MMRGIGLILFAGIALAFIYLMNRQSAFNEKPVFGGLFGNITDQAILSDIETGSHWYDYWRNVLTGTYERAGIMPPTGPLLCIAAPCPGTPIPQSP